MGPDPQTQSGSVRVAWLWAGRARVGPRGLASPLQIWQINSCPRGRWVGGKHALRQHVAPSESPSSPSKNGAARWCRSPRGVVQLVLRARCCASACLRRSLHVMSPACHSPGGRGGGWAGQAVLLGTDRSFVSDSTIFRGCHFDLATLYFSKYLDRNTKYETLARRLWLTIWCTIHTRSSHNIHAPIL